MKKELNKKTCREKIGNGAVIHDRKEYGLVISI
jgi:hypothetical protein